MNTYLSVGIGDFICLDSLLTKEEKSKFSEVYWGCRFGHIISSLLENNPDYPNVKTHHFITDADGLRVDGRPYWHFRPDYAESFSTAANLFGVNTNHFEFVIDAAAIFQDPTRLYQESSAAKYLIPPEEFWKKYDVKQGEYILVHYPTSTRPRSDISSIEIEDWMFIEEFRKKTNLKIIIVTDTILNYDIKNCLVLTNAPFIDIITLGKYCKYYAGCDSFLSILACKYLKKENLFIKTHDKNIKTTLINHTWLKHFFLPHPLESIQEFYKPYIGYPI